MLRLAPLVTGLALLATAAPAHAAPRVRLAGTVPTYARAARALGAVADGASVHAIVALKHRDQAGLDELIASVTTPGSASYGKFLTPAQFEARYAPSDASVQQVEAFAQSSGLRVRSVPRNNAYVEVTGTVAAAERAFATTISKFSLGGATVQAPSTALSVPAALRGIVLDVSGLDTGDVAHSMAGPPPAYVNTGACSTSWADTLATGTPPVYGAVQPAVPCGYTPQQLQGAYGLKPAHAAGLDGTGQRVAIIDAYSSPSIAADAAEWSKRHGLPAPTIEIHDTVTQRNAPENPTLPIDVPVVSGISDPQGWAGEETLDVEAVHAMAPGATIVYQGAESPLNMFLQMAQNAVVSGKLAPIVSNSYGGSTDTADDTSDATWQQAAATGIGVYFSSGDAGDQTNGGTDAAARAVGSGGNSPYVTSVGGTSLAVGKNDDYLFETYWGAFSSTLTGGAWGPTPGTFAGGGGGGTSQVYAQPDYQKGVVDPRFSGYWAGKSADQGKVDGSVPLGRVVPDVSMVGDSNTGFLIGLQENFSQDANPLSLPLPTDQTKYGEYRLGGTSLSSPLMAGVMALADQAAGKPHGFANPALYAARAAGAFRDVTAPAAPVAVVRTNFLNATNGDGGTETLLRTLGQTGTLTSQPGYDDATGLGSPQGLAFLSALAPGSALVAKAQAIGAPPAATPAAPVKPVAATCKPPASFAYALHAAKGQRVVRLTVTVGGKQVVSRTGRKLTKVTVKRPAKATFTVKVVSRTNKGAITTSSRTYTKSGCAKTAPKVSHSRARKQRK